MFKIMNFKAKKGKNKYNMFKRWIKKTHLKNPFYNKYDQNSNQVWSKGSLFYPTIGSYWILDHLVGHIFPFETIFYGTKLELRRMRYHKNTKTLIKSLLYFSGKLAVFYPTSCNKLTDWSRTGTNRLDHLYEKVPS